MASLMLNGAQNPKLISGIAPHDLGSTGLNFNNKCFFNKQGVLSHGNKLRVRKNMTLTCSMSASRPASQPRFIQHKNEAFWFLSPTPSNKWHGFFTNTTNTSTKFLLNAGFNEIEPDLNEDPRDQFATNGVDAHDFAYGIYDDHHTYHEGENKGTLWGSISEEIAAAEPPTGFQGIISWLFPPAIAAGVYFNVPGEYLYIGAGIFTITFCIIEMDKPDKPHSFEPHIYNMERGAR